MKNRRKLNTRKHHILPKGPISDDAGGGAAEEEKGPHHYRHYRCSSCVKDKDKKEREQQIEHQAEIIEKFETQTQVGLNAATFNALLASDTVFDSTKGLLIDPFLNSTSNSTTVHHLRNRI